MMVIRLLTLLSCKAKKKKCVLSCSFKYNYSNNNNLRDFIQLKPETNGNPNQQSNAKGRLKEGRQPTTKGQRFPKHPINYM